MMADKKENKKVVACPYCEAEIVETSSPLCRACGVKITYCSKCHEPIPKGKNTCPKCGTKVKVKV